MDFFASVAHARLRAGADDKRTGRGGDEPDCHHDPIRLQPRHDINEPSGPRPSTCRWTRPTSILAFGSGSRAFRPQRRISQIRSPISSSSGSSPVTTTSPTATQNLSPFLHLRSTRRHYHRPRYGAAPKLSALSAQTSGDDRMSELPNGYVPIAHAVFDRIVTHLGLPELTKRLGHLDDDARTPVP